VSRVIVGVHAHVCAGGSLGTAADDAHVGRYVAHLSGSTGRAPGLAAIRVFVADFGSVAGYTIPAISGRAAANRAGADVAFGAKQTIIALRTVVGAEA
jgi:hypothetical protein